jgi:hypothetical protein
MTAYSEFARSRSAKSDRAGGVAVGLTISREASLAMGAFDTAPAPFGRQVVEPPTPSNR